jgi:acetylornithine deacetylase/succinyl-diaminopimelate desuccinylase-like protein
MSPRAPRTQAIALTALALCVLAATARAQRSAPSGAELRARVRAYRAAHEPAILREFAALLEIPNVATDSANIGRNARAIASMLERRGVVARLLDGAGGPPAVYGELRAPRAARTVVLYAHYDGQPVDRSQWATDPWQPTLRDAPMESGGRVVPLPTRVGEAQGEWRLYARSASDDKAPIVAMLTALDALRAAGARPGVNLKFFFEGEEEAGSPHVRTVLERNAELLRADAWLFADGPVHQSRRPQVVFGVRGVMGLEVTTYGPSRALHSGHYGNWAPNRSPS